jgi:hypothetical protein
MPSEWLKKPFPNSEARHNTLKDSSIIYKELFSELRYLPWPSPSPAEPESVRTFGHNEEAIDVKSYLIDGFSSSVSLRFEALGHVLAFPADETSANEPLRPKVFMALFVIVILRRRVSIAKSFEVGIFCKGNLR